MTPLPISLASVFFDTGNSSSKIVHVSSFLQSCLYVCEDLTKSMKALSSHLKLSISRRFRNRRIAFVEILVRSANSFNTLLVLWCTWVNTCDINRNKKCSVFHLCVVASIFNVWLLWFWYYLYQYTCTCMNETEIVPVRPSDMSQNLIWLLPKIQNTLHSESKYR